MVGVGRDEEPEGGAVFLAGEEQGELVGFGAAGGDQGVGGACFLGEGAGDECFEGGGGGGLVPGVEGGVEGAGGEVGGGGDGEGRAVEVGGAQGVGGVGGACGEGVDEGAQGLWVALWGQDVAEGGLDVCGDGVGSACGQGAWACPGAVGECVEDGVEQGAQGVRAFGAGGEARCAHGFLPGTRAELGSSLGVVGCACPKGSTRGTRKGVLERHDRGVASGGGLTGAAARRVGPGVLLTEPSRS